MGRVVLAAGALRPAVAARIGAARDACTGAAGAFTFLCERLHLGRLCLSAGNFFGSRRLALVAARRGFFNFLWRRGRTRGRLISTAVAGDVAQSTANFRERFAIAQHLADGAWRLGGVAGGIPADRSRFRQLRQLAFSIQTFNRLSGVWFWQRGTFATGRVARPLADAFGSALSLLVIFSRARAGAAHGLL